MARIALPFALIAAVAATGCTRPRAADNPEVQTHYQYRHKGKCNAWAKSAKTGYRYCASPPFQADVATVTVGAAAAPAFQSVADGPTDVDSLRAHGEKVYGATCASCHQGNGQGLAGTFPPLAGAGSFYGDPQNHAKIVVHGLSGPIEVAGQSYSGTMPPQGGALSDYDVAAVLTYERTSWGNADGAVLPADVAAVR
ncbi:MAG: c-type cytochrome [Myxococcota bacterium]